jgi:hypothetical protein
MFEAVECILTQKLVPCNFVAQRVCTVVQKWSDHAPVILDMKDMPEHELRNLPPPCCLSSRGTPKNSLKSMFQRSIKPKATESAPASQVGSPNTSVSHVRFNQAGQVWRVSLEGVGVHC